MPKGKRYSRCLICMYIYICESVDRSRPHTYVNNFNLVLRKVTQLNPNRVFEYLFKYWSITSKRNERFACPSKATEFQTKVYNVYVCQFEQPTPSSINFLTRLSMTVCSGSNSNFNTPKCLLANYWWIDTLNVHDQTCPIPIQVFNCLLEVI